MHLVILLQNSILIMAKFSKYSNPVLFVLLNLSIAILLLFIGGYFVLYKLDDYTSHGEYITVPAFQKRYPDQAEILAKNNNLRVMVVDSIYDEKAKPGVILEQYPLKGAHVKENRMIQLITNAQNPEKIPFPQLANAPYRQTLQILQTKGFRPGKISYIPSKFKNLVLYLQYKGENISPGTLLCRGTVIDLVLGDGGNQNMISLPRLQRLQLGQALATLKENYLNIGEIISDGSIKGNGSSTTIVYAQEPNPDVQPKIQAGTYVRLYITADKEKIQELDSLLIVTE